LENRFVLVGDRKIRRSLIVSSCFQNHPRHSRFARSIFGTIISREWNSENANPHGAFVASGVCLATYRIDKFHGMAFAYRQSYMKNPTLYNMTRQPEDQRSVLLETLVYGSLLLSAVASMVFAATQPIIVPGEVVNKTAVTEHHA
jgi:hypothetical protein